MLVCAAIDLSTSAPPSYHRHLVTKHMLLQIGIGSDRRPSVSGPSRPDVITKPTSSSSHLPPLCATKSGKTPAAHGQVPRPHLRSRASLEKNKINIILTGTPLLTNPGIPSTSLSDKRTSSLPVPRANAHSSGSNSDSVKGHSHELAINVVSAFHGHSAFPIPDPSFLTTLILRRRIIADRRYLCIVTV